MVIKFCSSQLLIGIAAVHQVIYVACPPTSEDFRSKDAALAYFWACLLCSASVEVKPEEGAYLGSGIRQGTGIHAENSLGCITTQRKNRHRDFAGRTFS